MDEPHDSLLNWTDADFDEMGWHDCTLHALYHDAGTSSVVMDIDYILEWLPPVAPSVDYRFRVAPATLVFHEVQLLEIGVETQGPLLTVQDVTRDVQSRVLGDRAFDEWLIEGNEGEVSLIAGGFTQRTRQPAIETDEQRLTMAERGGISLEVAGTRRDGDGR